MLCSLTYSVSLSRQLDAAVLQLLHPLLQVGLLLHEGGEALLQLLHGSLQRLVHFHWHSSFWAEIKGGMRVYIKACVLQHIMEHIDHSFLCKNPPTPKEKQS